MGRECQKIAVSPQTGTHSPALAKSWGRRLLSEYFGLALTILLVAFLAPFTPGLLNLANFLNVAGYLLPLLIVAIGMTVVMICR